MGNNAERINAQMEIFNEEYDKFINSGNNAAGTRARKALSEVAKLTKDVRKEIQDAKNAK